MVISLHKKGKGKIEYTTVTEIVLLMTPSECNVSNITDKVSEQVGFPAVLLDSKCFPLIKNDSTSGVEFWKSTRKYWRLRLHYGIGCQVIYNDVNLADQAKAVDLTTADARCDEVGPARKRQCEDNLGFRASSSPVLEKITKIAKIS